MYFKYLTYLLKHKWFVFVAGLKVRVSIIQLITHDWSKFLPRELIPYARYFYGVTTEYTEVGFKRAWNYHQKTQPHHWQYWVLINGSDEPKVTPLVMPNKYVKEMVADWMGAGRAITGKWEVHDWYIKTKNKIILHDNTRAEVEAILDTLLK